MVYLDGRLGKRGGQVKYIFWLWNWWYNKNDTLLNWIENIEFWQDYNSLVLEEF